jgi:hypothetical protein
MAAIRNTPVQQLTSGGNAARKLAVFDGKGATIRTFEQSLASS